MYLGILLRPMGPRICAQAIRMPPTSASAHTLSMYPGHFAQANGATHLRYKLSECYSQVPLPHTLSMYLGHFAQANGATHLCTSYPTPPTSASRHTLSMYLGHFAQANGATHLCTSYPNATHKCLCLIPSPCTWGILLRPMGPRICAQAIRMPPSKRLRLRPSPCTWGILLRPMGPRICAQAI